MYWITQEEKRYQPVNTEDDIRVKLLCIVETDKDGNELLKPLVSDNDDFTYQFNVLYTSEIDVLKGNLHMEIHGGIMCFKTTHDVERYVNKLYPPKDTTFGYVEAVIPKDSTCYLNEWGEYVTTTLIIPRSRIKRININ